MHPLPSMIPANARPCECGCRALETPNRMTYVEARNHTVTENAGQGSQLAQRWFVKKSCRDGFLRDLELTSAMNTLAMRLEEAPFWRRVPHAWAVYSGAFNMALRLQGKKRARSGAFKFACFVILPPLVSGWLEAYWKGRHQRRSQGVVPKVLPAPPSA